MRWQCDHRRSLRGSRRRPDSRHRFAHGSVRSCPSPAAFWSQENAERERNPPPRGAGRYEALTRRIRSPTKGGHVRVTAIVGSYRRGGVVESAVDEILAAAKREGADADKIHLLDRRVEFCTNCRA